MEWARGRQPHLLTVPLELWSYVFSNLQLMNAIIISISPDDEYYNICHYSTFLYYSIFLCLYILYRV